MNTNLKIFEKNTFEFCCLIRIHKIFFHQETLFDKLLNVFMKNVKKSFILIGITISY